MTDAEPRQLFEDVPMFEVPVVRHRITDPTAAGVHRVPDHHTSVAAGLKQLGGRGTQRWRLAAEFAHVYPDGLTDEEAAIRAGIRPQASPWKRCSELRAWGYLEYAGIDRPTTTDTYAKVWRLTGGGMSAFSVSIGPDG